ncbi:hypothetical protein DSECCO2_639460 [anaerobic digester metagenome]
MKDGHPCRHRVFSHHTRGDRRKAFDRHDRGMKGGHPCRHRVFSLHRRDDRWRTCGHRGRGRMAVRPCRRWTFCHHDHDRKGVDHHASLFDHRFDSRALFREHARFELVQPLRFLQKAEQYLLHPSEGSKGRLPLHWLQFHRQLLQFPVQDQRTLLPVRLLLHSLLQLRLPVQLLLEQCLLQHSLAVHQCLLLLFLFS